MNIPVREEIGSMGQFCAGDFMPTEEKCAEVLRELRWKKGVKCPRCTSAEVTKQGKLEEWYRRYKCKRCGCHFNDLTGTVFERSKIELREFVYVAKRLFEKESMNQISKELGRCYRTIMRVRDLVTDRLAKKLLTRLEREVESTRPMFQPVRRAPSAPKGRQESEV